MKKKRGGAWCTCWGGDTALFLFLCICFVTCLFSATATQSSACPYGHATAQPAAAAAAAAAGAGGAAAQGRTLLQQTPPARTPPPSGAFTTFVDISVPIENGAHSDPEQWGGTR
jgi:hypothetical protein